MTPEGVRDTGSSVCFTMHGIGVSGGIAIGHAHLFAGMHAEVDHYAIGATDVFREQRRYDQAVQDVRNELKELSDSVRIAIVMGKLGLSREEADDRLVKAGGRISEALHG